MSVLLQVRFPTRLLCWVDDHRRSYPIGVFNNSTLTRKVKLKQRRLLLSVVLEGMTRFQNSNIAVEVCPVSIDTSIIITIAVRSHQTSSSNHQGQIHSKKLPLLIKSERNPVFAIALAAFSALGSVVRLRVGECSVQPRQSQHWL
jgi:hypothetical protein